MWQGQGVDDGFFEFLDDVVQTTDIWQRLAPSRCSHDSSQCASPLGDVPSKLTGISSGATTSIAIVCS
jgi:hypothetical protein